MERFSERARQVVEVAEAEARALAHPYLGTEHLLLGLIAVEVPARHALVAAGATAGDLVLRVRCRPRYLGRS